MRLIFRRSDAVIDQGHPEIDDQEIVIGGDVQLTYGTLREVDSGNPIAYLSNNEDWHIEVHRFDGIDDAGPYSDIIIMQDEG